MKEFGDLRELILATHEDDYSVLDIDKVVNALLKRIGLPLVERGDAMVGPISPAEWEDWLGDIEATHGHS